MTLVIALVAAVLVGGASGWLVASQVGPPEHTTVAPAPEAPGPESPPSTDRALGAALETCRKTWGGQQQAVKAADSSMDQWTTHITAMNRLVAGKITLDQAKAFWAKTRVGARQNVDQFHAVDERYRSASLDCPPPDVEPTTRAGPLSTAIETCRNGIAARDDELASARTALATWDRHIRHMEDFRAGKITATQATQMWHHMWQKGRGQMSDYRAVERNAGDADCPRR
ncbi:MAG: hypothetical protein ACRDPT_02030 [Streptomycetales bacterium]